MDGVTHTLRRGDRLALYPPLSHFDGSTFTNPKVRPLPITHHVTPTFTAHSRTAHCHVSPWDTAHVPRVPRGHRSRATCPHGTPLICHVSPWDTAHVPRVPGDTAHVPHVPSGVRLGPFHATCPLRRSSGTVSSISQSSRSSFARSATVSRSALGAHSRGARLNHSSLRRSLSSR